MRSSIRIGGVILALCTAGGARDTRRQRSRPEQRSRDEESQRTALGHERVAPRVQRSSTRASHHTGQSARTCRIDSSEIRRASRQTRGIGAQVATGRAIHHRSRALCADVADARRVPARSCRARARREVGGRDLVARYASVRSASPVEDALPILSPVTCAALFSPVSHSPDRLSPGRLSPCHCSPCSAVPPARKTCRPRRERCA
jgi:hypothetical protein